MGQLLMTNPFMKFHDSMHVFKIQYRVSQKNMDIFGNWYNSLIYKGISPKFCMVVAK